MRNRFHIELLVGAGLAACTTAGLAAQTSARQAGAQQAAAFGRMAERVNAGDAAGYAALYAPDAVIVIHGGSNLNSRAAIESYEVELLRQFPATRLAFYEIWNDGRVAVVHYGVNSPSGRGPATGHEGLLFYRFAATGLIAEERRYLDALTPMAQVGALGPAFRPALPALPATPAVFAANGSASEKQNLATVRRSIDALNAKDQRAFLADIAPGAEFGELMLPGAIGERTAPTWFDAWRRAMPNGTWHVTNAVAVGDYVLAELEVRGTLAAPLGPIAASDKALTVHRGAIIRLAGDKIASARWFMNGREVAEAVGQWPPVPRR